MMAWVLMLIIIFISTQSNQFLHLVDNRGAASDLWTLALRLRHPVADLLVELVIFISFS